MQNQVSSAKRLYSVECFSFTISSCNSFHLENHASVSRSQVCLWAAFDGECGPSQPLHISATGFQCTQRSATWLYMPLLCRLSITLSFDMACQIISTIDWDRSCVFLNTVMLVEVWCCASIVELEAMGVAVDTVVVTDPTKHHPSLERETFSFPPSSFDYCLCKGTLYSEHHSHQWSSAISPRGAACWQSRCWWEHVCHVRPWGHEYNGIRAVSNMIIASIVGSLMRWHISHCNKMPWLSVTRLLIGVRNAGRCQWSNPIPPPPAQKATPLVVFRCLYCYTTGTPTMQQHGQLIAALAFHWDGKGSRLGSI